MSDPSNPSRPNPAPLASASSSPTDVGQYSFEEALAELESIVAHLEHGKASLDSAIAAYERGAALKKHCESKLQEAREKVERITLDTAGQPVGTQPFETG